jgi:hypothetical protein
MFRRLVIALIISTGVVAAQTQDPATTPKPSLNPLFDKIWRIDSPTPYPHSSTIYIFLRNGTLLETSCVETYRIATWKPDPKQPETIEVTEDGRPAFTATVAAATARTLSLRQVMLLGDKSARSLTLTAIDKEFVCPDMPK